MAAPWDTDIAAMNLSPEEKNGLQVYRNYSRAFDEHRVKVFSARANTSPESLDDLRTLFSHLRVEEPRTLPVIACAYADDHLKRMFRREIPTEVPGGRSELLSGFGPLARLSQRMQIAFAFGWLSNDLLCELDLLRKVRNDLSHKWDLRLLEGKLTDLIERKQHPLEEQLGDGVGLPERFYESLAPMQRLRIRLIWLMGRVRYETALWVPALKERLAPQEALYGPLAPVMLGAVAGLCVEATRELCTTNES